MSELRVRAPAVAGTFYPSDPAALRDALARSFADARGRTGAAPPPKALIVPHAGYVYSGPVAASAFARLEPVGAAIRRVVLLGPSHRVPLDGIGVSSADAFATPLGVVEVDREARAAVLSLPGVSVADTAHAPEHSLEVELPFLQAVLDDFRLLPLVVGRCSADEVAAVLEAVWGGDETLVVVSTDLSHYHRYADAATLDARTAAAIVACDETGIADTDACGAYPLRGLLLAARRRHLGIEQLDLRSSGDTAGDKERVVGYGAFVAA